MFDDPLLILFDVVLSCAINDINFKMIFKNGFFDLPKIYETGINIQYVLKGTKVVLQVNYLV